MTHINKITVVGMMVLLFCATLFLCIAKADVCYIEEVTQVKVNGTSKNQKVLTPYFYKFFKDYNLAIEHAKDNNIENNIIIEKGVGYYVYNVLPNKVFFCVKLTDK